MNLIYRASAHPSARACLLLLCGYALCVIAELFCRLRGVGGDVMLKLTKWISVRMPPLIDGEYECIYSKGDLGVVESFYANFSNGTWRNAFGSRLHGLNDDPENFNWRGLASDPEASKP